MVSMVETAGLVVVVAILLTLLVLMVVSLFRPRDSRSDDGPLDHMHHPPPDGGAGGGGD